jgi:hypothetical protein
MIPSLKVIIRGKEFEGHAKQSTKTLGHHMHVIKLFFRSIGACGQPVMLFDDIQLSDPCSLSLTSSKLIPDQNASGVMYMATVGPHKNKYLN